jgi:hypothetical protein
MHEKPRLFDDLGLVALPTAVSCGRLFTQYTLTNWKVSPFVVADAAVIAGELVALAVQETGVAGDDLRWSELDHLNRVTLRLLGFPRHIVIEVWDAATAPAGLPEVDPDNDPQGLHLVDVTANRWASTMQPRSRLTWAELLVYPHTESGLPVRRPSEHVHPRPSGQGHVEHDDELLRRVLDGLHRL